jgi:hypothetical protein
MADTDRVLTKAKTSEIRLAQERIAQAYQLMKHAAQQSGAVQDAAALSQLGTVLMNLIELAF